MLEHKIEVMCPEYHCKQSIYYGVTTTDRECVISGCSNMHNCHACIDCLQLNRNKINQMLSQMHQDY